MAATPAQSLFLRPPDLLVEAHTQLSRALKDVEELSERQPEERPDYGDGMQNGDERKAIALHPRVARREHEPGQADGEQQHERHEVLREALHGTRSLVAHPAPH